MITIVYSDEYADQAATKIRVIEPLRFLARNEEFQCLSLQDIIRTYQKDGAFSFDNPGFEQADALYLFITDINHTNVNEMGAVINYFLQKGKPLVCNLDDHYFHVPDSITVKNEMQQNAALFEQLVRASRLVVVTGKALQQEIRRMNPNVLAVPNMIDPDRYPLRKGGNKKLRIGWCGLPSHFADLAIVIPAVKKLMETYPGELELTLFGLFNEDMKQTITDAQAMGLSLEEIAKKFPAGHFITDTLKMASLLEGMEYEHVPLVAYEDFPGTLSRLNFDIGLCPLRDTLFNRCKSAIKFAQYAAVGTVTVAARVYPYSAECNYLAENTVEDWYEKTARLIEDEAFRASLLEEQRDYILNHRNYHKGVGIYEALFKKIAGKTKMQ
jgi:glycosyltransferase involved in cell wall biosynthesis